MVVSPTPMWLLKGKAFDLQVWIRHVISRGRAGTAPVLGVVQTVPRGMSHISNRRREKRELFSEGRALEPMAWGASVVSRWP